MSNADSWGCYISFRGFKYASSVSPDSPSRVQDLDLDPARCSSILKRLDECPIQEATQSANRRHICGSRRMGIVCKYYRGLNSYRHHFEVRLRSHRP